MTLLCKKEKALPKKERLKIKLLAVAAVFLYKATAVGTLLVCRVRFVSTYDNFIKYTVTLLVVIVLTGKY